jgi:hypothetical protein
LANTKQKTDLHEETNKQNTNSSQGNKAEKQKIKKETKLKINTKG